MFVYYSKSFCDKTMLIIHLFEFNIYVVNVYRPPSYNSDENLHLIWFLNVFCINSEVIVREILTCLLWNGVLIPLFLLFLLMTFFSMKCLFCLVFIKLSVSLHIFLLGLAILWICFSLMILTEFGAQCSLIYLGASTSRINFPKLPFCKWFYKLWR